VDLAQEVPEGWGVASDSGVTVALDLEMTDALRREGTARELVRAVQDARRSAGLDVSDRISLGIAANGDAAAAFDEHRDYIARETLAIELGDGSLDGDAHRAEVDVDGVTVSISLRRAASPTV
jgi:isoleucyl-tRNA synthetase